MGVVKKSILNKPIKGRFLMTNELIGGINLMGDKILLVLEVESIQ